MVSPPIGPEPEPLSRTEPKAKVYKAVVRKMNVVHPVRMYQAYALSRLAHAKKSGKRYPTMRTNNEYNWRLNPPPIPIAKATISFLWDSAVIINY